MADRAGVRTSRSVGKTDDLIRNEVVLELKLEAAPEA